MPRSEKEIDVIVGSRIQELRLSMGMSRVALAEKIGVAQQQLQKYEKGKNRICVARLAKIAKAMKKSTSYFLIGLSEEAAENEELPNHHQRMAIEVSRNFMRIKNQDHQKAVHHLIKSLGNGA